MSFQSLRLFRLAAELEGKAAALRKEALQHLTVALAGTDTKELFTLLVTFFGKGTDVDPFSFIDAAPVIKRPLDLTDTESESEAGDDAASTSTTTTTTAEPSTSTGATSEAPAKKPVKIKQKASYSDKCVDVQEAVGFLPENSGTLHNTGIPEQFAVRRVGKNEHGTSIYSCPHPECSDPPYTGDISGCGSHVRRVHLGRCVSCPYCPDKKYYNADGWRRHMREKHNKAPWYSGELQSPSEPAASSTSSADPAIPEIPVSLWKDEEAPADTLPHEETLPDDSTSPDDDKDPPKVRPLTPSAEEIREQMKFLPSDTRDYDYCTHSTGHPAAPVITSRYRRFDTPDESQEAAQALVSSTLSEVPQPEPGETPLQRKRRKVDPSLQIEVTRSIHWKPSPKRDPDDDVPPSTA